MSILRRHLGRTGNRKKSLDQPVPWNPANAEPCRHHDRCLSRCWRQWPMFTSSKECLGLSNKLTCRWSRKAAINAFVPPTLVNNVYIRPNDPKFRSAKYVGSAAGIPCSEFWGYTGMLTHWSLQATPFYPSMQPSQRTPSQYSTRKRAIQPLHAQPQTRYRFPCAWRIASDHPSTSRITFLILPRRSRQSPRHKILRRKSIGGAEGDIGLVLGLQVDSDGPILKQVTKSVLAEKVYWPDGTLVWQPCFNRRLKLIHYLDIPEYTLANSAKCKVTARRS